MNSKIRQIIKIVKEITVTSSNSYDISGLDLNLIKIFYREPQRTYQDLPLGDYVIDSSGGTQTLVIQNQSILDIAEAIQICYVLDLKSSEYIVNFDVDINTLKDSHNKAVQDIHDLWEYIKELGFTSDAKNTQIILPELEEGEVWVRTEDSYRGFQVGKLDQEIQDLLSQITAATIASVASITAEGDTQVLRVQTTGADRIEEQGDAQVARVISEGNTQDARIVSQGDTQDARVENQGDTQNTRIIGQGDTQDNRIETEGDTQYNRVHNEGVLRYNNIVTEGNTQTNRVTTEGNTQDTRIITQGDTQDDRIIAEGDYQKNRLQDLIEDGIKQLPHPSILGAFYAEGNILRASGIFTKIHGLNRATVEYYGDSVIFRTPDNSFSCIAWSGGVYSGPGFTNLLSKNSPLTTKSPIVTHNIDSITIETALSATTTLYGFGQGHSALNIKANTQYTMSCELIDTDIENLGLLSIVAPSDRVAISGLFVFQNSPSKGHITFTTDSNISSIVAYLRIDGSVPAGSKLTFRMNIVEGTEEKPFTPPQYVMPDCSIKFDGAEGLDDSDSYILKSLNFHNTVNCGVISQSEHLLGILSADIVQEKDYYYSKTTNNGLRPIGGTIGDDSLKVVGGALRNNVLDNKVNNFSQLICYQGSRTQSELETELAKNLLFSDSININEQVEFNMKIRAVLGVDETYNIKDGKSWTVDDYVWDDATHKYYRCTADNQDDFIDLLKWEVASLDELRKKAEQANLQHFPNVTAGKELSFDSYGENIYTCTSDGFFFYSGWSDINRVASIIVNNIEIYYIKTTGYSAKSLQANFPCKVGDVIKYRTGFNPDDTELKSKAFFFESIRG